MSLTEREKEIALEVKQEMSPYTNYLELDEEGVKEFADIFLSRIREEQEAVAEWSRDSSSDEIVFKVIGDPYVTNGQTLFTTPPASDPKEHDCSELVEPI